LSFWAALAIALSAGLVLAPLVSPPPAPPPGQPPPTPENVWSLLARTAPADGVDPRFAYAIAMAESNLDPHAFDRGARGLMQMRLDAWESVSSEPFREAWNWEKNAGAALKYLASCRDFLTEHHAYSSGLLAACYHYGPQAVADADFQIANLPRPHNSLYRQLFNGDAAPVPPPSDAAASPAS
jgi:hypothetical protein